LALNYSPDGAFSPDSSMLAVVNEDKVALMDLRGAGMRKTLRPRIPDITDLQIQSANFLDQSRLFLLGTGLARVKGKGPGGATPLLAFQWDIDHDVLSGKVNAVAPGGGFGPARYFPLLRYLVLYKDSAFDLWSAAAGRGGRINIPLLTRQPRIYDFSLDGHWLLLAQIEGSSSADPVVVKLSEHQFVDSLQGHQGTVLSMAFSRDSQKVLTACEDTKVRIWSVSGWKLERTLTGHQGPVHWAEFSPDGHWVASGGEDTTVRIWSVADGKLVQTLAEAESPVLTIAFSPNDAYLAASTEQTVLVWERR
jgi:WD40 repeat protein